MKIAEYKELIKTKELLTVAFATARNQEEVFITYDEEDDIELRLPYREYFTSYNKKENALHAFGVIRNAKNVIVKSVDEENKIVTLSYLGALAIEREEAQKQIDAKLEKGEDVRVRGIVIDVRGVGSRSFAVIRFRDSNLKGLLWIDRWSPAFVNDIKEKASVGMEIEIDIVAYNKSNVEPRCRYICARDVVIGNIWAGIEKRYQKGDYINVKCEGVWGASYYSGSLVGEKELPVRMLIPKPKQGEPPLYLVPGLVYQCIVTGVGEENHTFRALPVRLCNVEPGVKKVVKTTT